MKKILTVSAISVCCFMMGSCVFIKPVKLTGISNFQTVNTGDIPEFRFDASIMNPNKFSVKVDHMDIGIFLDTISLVKTVLLQESELTKKESSLITVAMKPGTNSLTQMFGIGVNSFLSGKVPQMFSIKGEISIRKWIFKRRYQFTEPLKL